MPVDTIKSTIGYGSNPTGRPDTDFYETPRIAVEKLLAVESFKGPILEPACGKGAISKVLIENGYDVVSTDLYDYGYGDTGVDFLTDIKPAWPTILTNCPYNLAEEFVVKGLALVEPVQGKLALLLRLSFLEGQRRKGLFENSPLENVWVFSKRITFTRPGETRKLSGMMAFSWLVWNYEYKGRPKLGWI